MLWSLTSSFHSVYIHQNTTSSPKIYTRSVLSFHKRTPNSAVQIGDWLFPGPPFPRASHDTLSFSFEGQSKAFPELTELLILVIKSNQILSTVCLKNFSHLNPLASELPAIVTQGDFHYEFGLCFKEKYYMMLP
jgi:hypothetical protein